MHVPRGLTLPGSALSGRCPRTRRRASWITPQHVHARCSSGRRAAAQPGQRRRQPAGSPIRCWQNDPGPCRLPSPLQTAHHPPPERTSGGRVGLSAQYSTLRIVRARRSRNAWSVSVLVRPRAACECTRCAPMSVLQRRMPEVWTPRVACLPDVYGDPCPVRLGGEPALSGAVRTAAKVGRGATPLLGCRRSIRQPLGLGRRRRRHPIRQLRASSQPYAKIATTGTEFGGARHVAACGFGPAAPGRATL
eukprot:350168-Chlamydomonas_euryale.AAC.3